MKDYEKVALEFIDSNAYLYTDISHKVWSYAELSLKEYKSAALYEQALKDAGFKVETGLSGIETALCGSFGSGRPYIGILGEYDALSGLSQKAGSVVREPVEGKLLSDPGHGCGHNMLGAAAFGAACAIKDYLEKSGKSGTIIFYGCPGEEGGASKAFMAGDGFWKDLDCALTWHPLDSNQVITGTCNSCIQVLYKFHGVSSHAAGDPEKGRSALDAVELMNTGVQYLREHMKSDCRIHYAIINAGGVSPNVVQPDADVLYMVRAVAVADSVALQARVDKIAEGAALMTETSYERIFVDGTANTVDNRVLQNLVQKKLEQIPLPEYTKEELEYAEALVKTYNPDVQKAINDEIKPLNLERKFSPGSTDVGDVSWLTPTVQFNTVCKTADTPGHSWQLVSCAASSIGDKGLIHAAKVLAATAIDLYENPEKLEEARKEFEERTASGYTCPIPEGENPYIIE
jgi:aminobenzoyl-glutamate utilization protein B